MINILYLYVFAFAAGIASYFMLPVEVGAPLAVCALCAACFFRYKDHRAAAVFAFLFGFFYSAWRADLIDTKLLRRNQWSTMVSGLVERVDYVAGKDRIFLRTNDSMLLRISLPPGENCAVGSHAEAKVRLYAPNEPDAFNRFDYARWSFFNGLSGGGSAGSIRCAAPEGRSRLRDKLHFSADNKLVDALVLGYGGAIPRREYDVIKATGIAHVFSISGFHMTLVGGWLFIVFLFLAKLIPVWTRRYPARNLALPLTAVGLALYLSLSGSEVATIRSFVMACAGFAAILAGRKILTIRSAVLVFFAMLVAQPFWLVSAGFQLSFAAIFGMFAFFDSRKAPYGRMRGAIWYLVMSSIVATVWTFPFIAYHFGSFQLYGLIGNLVLLPVFSLGIMPVVMIGTIWRWPLFISDWLYGAVLSAADIIAKLPFAQIEIPDVPSLALFMVFAGMFCVLISERRRAVILFAFAALFAIVQPRPVLRATADGEVVGFREYYNTTYSANHPFAISLKNKWPGCRKGVCIYDTPRWRAVSFQKFLPLAGMLPHLCEYDFIISYLPLELPACPDKVIRGGVRIYENGWVERVKSRKWNET